MRQVTDCADCPLRARECFTPFSTAELGFVERFKTGELHVEPGARVLSEGANSPHFFTVLSGFGFREKSLEDGRRQILNYVLPGGLIGLQAALFDEMEHSVEALTEMTLCVFQRDRIYEVFRKQPSMAFRVVWHSAHEERLIDANLASLGRHSARERIAYALMSVFNRARDLGLVENGDTMWLPITQQHLADTLGLSLVHTNKTLKRLVSDGLVSWKSARLTIVDEPELRRLAQFATDDIPRLPLI